MSDTRPNILFITADQWRGDCLGYAGHDVVKTPNMDALAAEGTAFMQHYAAASPCSPARAAMYTGLYQMNNRVVANGAPLDHRFDNVARAARRAGYAPTLFGYTDIAADPRAHDPNDPAGRTYEGVLPGFDVEQPLIGDRAPWKRWLKSLGYAPEIVDDPYRLAPEENERVPTGPAGFKAEHSQTAYLTGRLMDWLEQHDADQGWFAHLSLIHPHPPFIAPAPYNDMYDPDLGRDFQTTSPEVMADPVVQMLLNKPVDDFVPGVEGNLPDLSVEDKRRIRSVYFGLITEVDAQLGRLFDHIKAAGQWDNTIIIMTSDHGEMMGDYGLFGKGGFFPDSQQIPLIIRLPGQTDGRVCNSYTSAVDLFPTLLGLIGGRATNALDGQDLGPILRAQTDQTGQDAAYWEFDYRDRVPMGEEATEHLADFHLQARLDADMLYVSSPASPPLLFETGATAICAENVAEQTSFQGKRLHAAEALLRFRQRRNDQTLADLRVGPEGVKRVGAPDL